MAKFGLRDWAQIAEITASVGVIISLVFVAVSIERSNSLTSAEMSDDTYVALRVARELALQDRELLVLTQLDKEDLRHLDGIGLALYKEWVILHLDEWERLYAREQDGVIQSKNLEGWYEYFRIWFKRHVPPEIWNEIRWRHTTDGFKESLDAEMSESEPTH